MQTSYLLRPFDGAPSVSSTERAEIRAVLHPLACVAAVASRPVPCTVEWLSRNSGVPPPRVVAALVVLERLGMAVHGPEGWSMSPLMHEVCSLAVWEEGR
jgi:DNA-binding IclR family transcriptional regulator